MSDDPTNPEEEQASEDPDAGHDDIMKRLVDYQRQLRQGVEPTEAAAVAWHREPRDPEQAEQSGTRPDERDVVDVSSPEPEAPVEAEVQSAEREDVEPFDQPSDRVEILTRDEAEASPERPWESPPVSGHETTRTDVSARIAQLEGTLDRLSKLLGDLRENFQGMAVTADERLAAIEAEIERNRERPDDPS